MSQGSIIDFKILVNPSPKLIEFIINLKDTEAILPINIINIIEACNSKKWDKSKIEVFKDTIKSEKLTENEINILKDIETGDADLTNLTEILNFSTHENQNAKSNTDCNKKKQKNNEYKETKKFSLELNDLKWLNRILVEQRNEGKSEIYMHEILQGSELILPQNEIIPRNPELEARCRKLKEEQDMREYRSMTKNVDSTRKDLPDDTVGYQIKVMNRQLIAVLQFVFSVAAGFAFGFLGVELIVGNLDFGFRLLLGIMCSLTIALAEIYFLAKKLSEYDDVESDFQHPNGKKPHLD